MLSASELVGNVAAMHYGRMACIMACIMAAWPYGRMACAGGDFNNGSGGVSFPALTWPSTEDVLRVSQWWLRDGNRITISMI